MQIDAIGATTGSASTDGTSSASGATGSQELDREAFLTLLLAQLANQDPLEPIKDQAFVAQLAQFSSLEQLENISASIDTLVALNQNLAPIPEADVPSTPETTEG